METNNDDRGLLYLLYLYLIPFWLFRDASRGDFLLREQNYRYNREQRKYLPGYLLKWTVLCALLLTSYQSVHALGAGYPSVLWAVEMFAGISFAIGAALMANIAAIWGYLTFVD
ncbi:hypothetical protein QU481_00800 [Crenobacter sp. SG2303]|uniref:Uncharacterized protein n=1 Tax=Crenobacter oryzisoli TaxID=3056844 RepID=A0ABT7XI41_9NEIS|nr:hypothetical protein [Crenobacter sp. SG2303]MDN0073438.1 hypothetical protein [Crenobacter sp. SG2303]